MLSKREIVQLLNGGAVGVMPTDTVYGLVCSASNPTAVASLYQLKSRTAKPGTVIAASVDELVKLGIPRRYLRAVEQYWPNPLSVVVPVGQQLAYLHQSKGSLAVRIPKDATLLHLLKQTGPLLTTSANHPGETTAHTIESAKQYFGNKIDFYIDGGDLSYRHPSTIIRVVDDAVEILRAGAVVVSESGEITL